MLRQAASRRVLASAAAILLAATVAAPDRARAEDPRIAELFDVSGLDASITSLPDAFLASADKGAQMDEPLKDAFRRLVPQHFDAPGIRADMLPVVDGALTPAVADELLAWYRTEAGARIAKLERAALDPAARAAQNAEGPALLQALIDSDDPRLALFRRADAAIRAVDTSVAVVRNMAYAMFSGMVGSSRIPGALSDEQILDLVDRMEPALRRTATETIYLSLAHDYRALSNAEFEAYVEFLETPAALSFHAAALAGFDVALTPRSRAFGHALMVERGVREL